MARICKRVHCAIVSIRSRILIAKSSISACGKRLISASDTGANPELIREGIDGYLYKFNDIEDMTDKAMKIISSSNIGG